MKRYITKAISLMIVILPSSIFGYEIGDIYYINEEPVGIVIDVDATGKNGLVVSKQEYNGIFFTINPGLGWTTSTTRTEAYAKIVSNGISSYPVYVWCTGLGEGWLIPTISDYQKIYDLWNGSSSTENAAAQATFNATMTNIGGNGISVDYTAVYNPSGASGTTPTDAYWTCNADANKNGLQAFIFQERNNFGATGTFTRRARAVYAFSDQEPGPEITNIALNKPTTVSGAHDSGNYPGSKAVDGILVTDGNPSRWISENGTGEHWIEISLGGTCIITSTQIYRDLWNGGTQKNPTFEFQIWSAISMEWETVYSVTGNTTTYPCIKEFESEIKTTKVRYYVPPYTDNCARIYEIEVYGYLEPIPVNPTGLESNVSKPASIYSNNNLIYITANSSVKQVLVYDLQGSLVYVQNNIDTSSCTINPCVSSGIYVVKVVSENTVQTAKLLF